MKRHGLSRTPEYKAWQTMRLRCTNPQNQAYADYGGRGITVCSQWLDSVETFVKDMGLKPSPKHELDRIRNNEGYSPDNCHWTTRSNNARNRRSNRWVTYKGERMVLAAAIQLSGLDGAAVAKRLDSGWPEDLALSVPVKPRPAKGCGKKALIKPMTNKHGFKGVKYDVRNHKFFARRLVNGVRVQSRGFDSADLAHQAYLAMVDKT
jgi:hypothetical protein